MSLRRRLLLLVAGAIALAVAALVTSVYLVVSSQLHDQVEQQLFAAGLAVQSALTPAGGLPGPQNPPTARSPNIPRIIDTAGTVVETRGPPLPIPVTPEARAVAAGNRASSLETLPLNSERFGVLTLPLGPDRALQVMQSLAPVDAALGGLLRTSLIVGSSIALLAPLIGYAVAGGALVPVRRLSRTAERVARTADLAERAEVDGSDELASLAASFNSMLDRLQEVVAQLESAQRAQRQLVADASHELRTPLTTLRANLELLALDQRGHDVDRDEVVADTLAQIDDLAVLMGQLIDLAREDEREPQFTPVHLDQVVGEALDRVRQHYSAVSFDVELEPTVVAGSEESLSRAVANLLDNAGKWSQGGGRVEVALRDATLSVRDHGPGIDDDDLPHVFQRFYRGARGRGSPGSGLGLAIVARVVASHGGDVWAERPPDGGALFRMKLPTPDS